MVEPIFVGCHSSNFSPGRNGQKPCAIVIHRADDKLDNSIEGVRAWFHTPKWDRGPNGMASSAHYCVRADGQLIHQYVQEVDTAYHAGRLHGVTKPLLYPNISPNRWTIGVEHEGKAGDPWPEEMLRASRDLCLAICACWDIPFDLNHIYLHREIFSLKTCPGPTFDLLKYLEGYDAADPAVVAPAT